MNGRETLISSMYTIEQQARETAIVHKQYIAGKYSADTLASVVNALMTDLTAYEQAAEIYIKGKYARFVVVDAVTSYAAWVAIHNDTSKEKRFHIIDLIYDAVEI